VVWSPAPSRLPGLDAASVHVWRIALAVPDAEQAERAAVGVVGISALACIFDAER